MSHFLILFFISTLISPSPTTTVVADGGGQWQLLQPSIGISAMHMQLMNDDRVVIFDRTDFGSSNISLAEGVPCRKDITNPQVTLDDCSAHSVQYDTITNTIRPLTVLTDTWCSSGTTLPSGMLAQTGGYNQGIKVVRLFRPSCKSCDWEEHPNTLLDYRWYASNHILPDGTTILMGGRNVFTYEYYPKKTTISATLYNLPFLQETSDPLEENNLYPFVFLNVDGNLFIFANNRAILYDYTNSAVVRTYPTIPGGDPRNYPCTGSGVLLPLKNLELGLDMEVEVLVCGGAPQGSYVTALTNRQFTPALKTCGRLKISDANPSWVIETMPIGRLMGDMVTLPNGDVILINGAGSGAAGWELARDPVLEPVIYHPDNAPESRFEVQASTSIPRMYHSCAILARDGRVLVGGSNPHQDYNFTGVLYPTELSLEAFSPPYLDPSQTEFRPIIKYPYPGKKIQYGKSLNVKFYISGSVTLESIKVTMLRPPFNSHSFSMNQRLLVLTNVKPAKSIGSSDFEVQVTTPNTAAMAPPGYYMMFVVHQNVPSVGLWIRIA